MTDEDYTTLSRQATKGDRVALQGLFTLAETVAAGRRFEEATTIFKDAAICYRIAAFRERTRAEAAESRAQWLEEVQSIYRVWIEAHPNGLEDLPYQGSSVTLESIREIVVEELLHDPRWSTAFAFLHETLAARGVEFYSPGGSLQRRVTLLLGAAFGLHDADMSKLLREIPIRIGLDLLADEVRRRHASNARG